MARTAGELKPGQPFIFVRRGAVPSQVARLVPLDSEMLMSFVDVSGARHKVLKSRKVVTPPKRVVDSATNGNVDLGEWLSKAVQHL